jgi:pyruvate/2-oxoglutarate/acetoin dehydrogenase E1 component
MGEDVGKHGGVFRATDGLWKEFGDNRVIDTPLAELGIVGIAIGAAMNGMRPIAEIQFADFMAPAFDQIVNEAARLRYRSAGDWTCPMVIRAPYGGGIHGALYHSQCVEAFYAHVPGLKVLCPSTPYDAKGLLKSAIRDEDPVMFFEHKKTYRLIKGEVPDGDYTVPIGKADVKREGTDLSLFTYGMMVHHSLEAAEKAVRQGKARFVGISMHGQPDVLIEALNAYDFAAVMTTVNYYDRFNFPEIEDKLLPLANQKGTAVILMKPLADGLLWRSAEPAFRYAFSRPVSVVVTGINSCEMLAADLKYAAEYTPMTDAELEALYRGAPELGSQYE